MNWKIVLTVVLAGLPPAAWAQDSYPDPDCRKPDAARVKLPDVHPGPGAFDNGAVGSYNSRIKAFNRDQAAYNDCIHAYIDTANRDAKTVQDKTNAELKEVSARGNASMKLIQDKIRRAVAEANELGAALEAQTARLRKN